MDQNCSKPKKNEARSLLKKCFRNPLFSLVPFEIWRDLIVPILGAKSVLLLSRTCWAFKEVVDDFGGKNFYLALIYRKKGQIHLARKYLLKCAENSNSTATFHLGYAYRYSGWGLKVDNVKSVEWLKKAAESGSLHAISEYACLLFSGIGIEINEELSNYWARKALSSSNHFAVGICHYSGIGTPRNNEKAFLCFEKSAKEGDEFAQFHLGRCFDWGDGVKIDKAKALFWYLKSANQGLCRAQHLVAKSIPSSKENKKKILWCQKAARQGNDQCMKELKDLGINF